MSSRWLSADRPLVIAHRGASAAAPENTLAAFHLAAEQGADGVELDVRRTKDDQLVVIHEAMLDRTTDGGGRVADLTWEEIRRPDAGKWFAPAFAGQRVPLLSEVLALARGHRHLLVDIELKEPRLDAMVVAAVAEAQMADAVLITSFQREAIAAVAGRTPHLPVGLLFSDGGIDQVLAADVQFALPAVAVLTADGVEACHRRGVRVITWTARTEMDVRRAVDFGVDGIIADDPILVRRVVGS